MRNQNSSDPVAEFQKECEEEVFTQGEDLALQAQSLRWLTLANERKYSYHFSWLGRPIIQYPQDIVAMQELIWRVKPDLIIETGIAHGGSLVLHASILAMIEYCEAATERRHIDPLNPRRKVIGIDIDIRPHNRSLIQNHPLSNHIEMIEGSSISSEVIAQVENLVKDHSNVLVVLDSNHTHDHVLEELNLYSSFVSQQSYLVVFDTVIEDLPESMFPNRNWGPGNNPKTAVHQFLTDNETFVIDKSIDHKLLISVAPDGFLRKL
jgi:cephalosporin hydroxylase